MFRVCLKFKTDGKSLNRRKYRIMAVNARDLDLLMDVSDATLTVFSLGAVEMVGA